MSPFLLIGFSELSALVTTFNLEIGITGAILTKLDGDSRGGAALSVKEVCLFLWMFKFMTLFDFLFCPLFYIELSSPYSMSLVLSISKN